MVTRTGQNNHFYTIIVLSNFLIYYFACMLGYELIADYMFHSSLSFIAIMLALYCMAFPAPPRHQYWIKFAILLFTGASLIMLLGN
jgi:hypothetical protein